MATIPIRFSQYWPIFFSRLASPALEAAGVLKIGGREVGEREGPGTEGGGMEGVAGGTAASFCGCASETNPDICSSL